MSTYQDAKAFHIWFDSIEEMEREIPSMTAVANGERWNHLLNGTGRYKDYNSIWYYARTSQEAMAKCRDGWPELMEQLKPMIAKLRQSTGLATAAAVQVDVRRRKIRRGDNGDSLDMSRVWSGDLDTAWSKPVKFPRLSASQRYATIFADCSVSAHVNAVETLWRAAAAYCMVEMFNGMGVNTEVWSGLSGTECYQSHAAPYKLRGGVRVKQFSQPINENRLATMLCAPFYRTWLFGMYMCGPWQSAGGLGHIDDSKELVKPLDDRKQAGERVISMGRCLSFSDAVREVESVIKTLRGDQAA